MRHLILNENEEKAIKSLKRTLSENFALIDLRLFGSKARGDSDFESDIDVMIEVAESNPDIESHINDIVFKINIRDDAFICPIIFSQKEIEEGPLAESPIYKIIQKEGIPL